MIPILPEFDASPTAAKTAIAPQLFAGMVSFPALLEQTDLENLPVALREQDSEIVGDQPATTTEVVDRGKFDTDTRPTIAPGKCLPAGGNPLPCDLPMDLTAKTAVPAATTVHDEAAEPRATQALRFSPRKRLFAEREVTAPTLPRPSNLQNSRGSPAPARTVEDDARPRSSRAGSGDTSPFAERPQLHTPFSTRMPSDRGFRGEPAQKPDATGEPPRPCGPAKSPGSHLVSSLSFSSSQPSQRLPASPVTEPRAEALAPINAERRLSMQPERIQSPRISDLVRALPPLPLAAQSRNIEPRMPELALNKRRGLSSPVRQPPVAEASQAGREQAASTANIAQISAVPAQSPLMAALVESQQPQPNAQPQTSAPPAGQPAPLPLAEPSAQIRSDNRVASQVDQAIEQLADAREAGRAARPAITVRHSEFGQINMRIEATGTDLRATVNARDPGFLPAIQTALAERGIAAAAETNSGQSQRGHDQGSGNSPSHSSANGHGQNSDARYGSSTGSGHASSQPYREHTGGEDEEAIAQLHSGGTEAPAGEARTRGLFA